MLDFLDEDDNKEDLNDEFKVLSEREHVLKRSNMYVGSTSLETHEMFIDGKLREVKYVPALAKIIDEILDNSVDEAIRTNFEYANEIDITVKNDAITISDNGRGIPQGMKDLPAPEKGQLPIPVLAWTRTKTGSNFEDEGRITGGMNGVGSALTNIYSTSFVGKTANGKTEITVSCVNNCSTYSYNTKKSKHRGTTVTFIPDYSRFESMTGVDADLMDIINERIITLSLIFPLIKFSVNGKKIKSDFKAYVKNHNPESAMVATDKISLAIIPSDIGTFKQLSYVNNIKTIDAGSHIDYITNSLCDELIVLFDKKDNIKITKARIIEFLYIVAFLHQFENVKFNGQNKDKLTNTNGEVKSHIDVDFKKLATKIYNTSAIIKPIKDSMLARINAEQVDDLKKAEKELKNIHIPKYVKAKYAGHDDKETSLFLVEGDSAKGAFVRTANRELQGCYPLRGKPLNVRKVSSKKDVLDNNEMSEMMAILNLKFSSKPFIYMEESDIWYKTSLNGRDVIYNGNDELLIDNEWTEFKGEIVDPSLSKDYKLHKVTDIRRKIVGNNITYNYIDILTDADVDGTGAIYPLLLSFFSLYWIDLFKYDRVRFTNSPIMIASKGKDDRFYYDESEYLAELNTGVLKGYKVRYIKGLGSLNDKEYKKVVQEPRYDIVRLPNNYNEVFDFLYGKSTSKNGYSKMRQEWMLEGNKNVKPV